MEGLRLKFSNPAIEAGFLESRRDRLAGNLGLLGFVISFMLLVHAAGVFAVGFPHPVLHRVPEAFVIAKSCLGVSAAIALTGLLTGIFMQLQLRFNFFSALGLEVIGILLSLASLCAGLLADHWVMSRLYGVKDPGEEFQQVYTDVWMLLLVDIVVTVSHMSLEIRACMLWPLEVIGVLSYPLVGFTIGLPHNDHTYSHMCMLLTLVFVAVIGKRTIERHERQSYLSLIQERTLRAESEFKLHSTSILDRKSSPQDPSQLSSRGYLFDDFDQSATEFVESFQKLAEIGKKERWLVSPDDVKVLPNAVLGEGSWGVVVAGFLHETAVAVKVPLRQRGQSVPHQQRENLSLLNELRVLRQVRHPNIAGFQGALVDSSNGRLSLILELVNGVTLRHFVQAPRAEGQVGHPSSSMRFHVLWGITHALQYLHSHAPPIVHGDLTPVNVLVESTGSVVRPKLLDFGLSRVLARRVKPLGGTLAWVAPEVVGQESGPMSSADVFSFGRIIFFVATGEPQLAGLKRVTVVEGLRSGRLPEPVWTGPLDLISMCRPIAEACLQWLPEHRPTTRDLCTRFSSAAGAFEWRSEGANLPRADAVGWPSGLDAILRRDVGRVPRREGGAEAGPGEAERSTRHCCPSELIAAARKTTSAMKFAERPSSEACGSRCGENSSGEDLRSFEMFVKDTTIVHSSRPLRELLGVTSTQGLRFSQFLAEPECFQLWLAEQAELFVEQGEDDASSTTSDDAGCGPLRIQLARAGDGAPSRADVYLRIGRPEGEPRVVGATITYVRWITEPGVPELSARSHASPGTTASTRLPSQDRGASPPVTEIDDDMRLAL